MPLRTMHTCIIVLYYVGHHSLGNRSAPMPMVDVYAAVGTFSDKHQLAVDLAPAVMKVEQVPDIAMFRQNTAAFVHDLPADSLSNVDGDSTYVRVQVLTNAGALDRDKQLALVPASPRSWPRRRRPDPDPAHLGAPDRGARRRLGAGRARQHQCRAGGGRPRRARRPAQPVQLARSGGRRWLSLIAYRGRARRR